MLDIIVEITKVYLMIVGTLLMIDLLSFLMAHWAAVLAVTVILALLVVLFILLLPVLIIIKIFTAL